MIGSARQVRTPITVLVSLALALLLFATTGANRAQAAYTVETFSCSPGAPTDASDAASGSYDSNGNLYIPCGNPNTDASSIYKYDPQGNPTKLIDVPYDVSDVAPSPTGNYLYLARGDKTPKRLNRDANGAYTVDGVWKLARFPMDASVGWYIDEPQGLYIDTDDAGNIYLSNGAWTDTVTNGEHTVVKYGPGGGYLTRFGDKNTTWDLGYFYHQLNGIAVKGDGSKVYTVEGGNNRVQVWTRQGTTATSAYTATSSFGGNANNNADRQGYCKYDGWEGKFASPYDIALDATETNLFVLNTSCHQVMEFTTGGAYNRSTTVGTDNANGTNRPHGFAVAKNGEVYIGQSGKKLALPQAPAPTASITGGPTEGSTDTDTTPTFEFTSIPEGSTFQCKFDAEAYAGCTSPYTRNVALATGQQHTFSVKATKDGLTGAAATRTWTVGNPPPPPPGTCKDETATLAGSDDPSVPDNLTGRAGLRDVIDARSGDDTIGNLDNTDVACGGDGYDTFKRFSGSSQVDGGDETGDRSADVVDFSWITQPDANGRGAYVALSGISDGNGFEVTTTEVEDAVGSSFPDTMYGDNMRNTIYGGAGNDLIDGGAEAAGAPGDRIFGEAGNDTIRVRDGSVDTVDCGDGDDAVVSDPSDTVAANCETNDTGGIDNTPPTGTVKINRDAASTRDRAVVLNSLATDPNPGSGVAQMRFSHNGQTWKAWETYAVKEKWTLKKGKSGTRVVYAQFMDGAGNPSEVVRDTIKYRL